MEGLIRSVGNDTYRLLLECRYIDGRTWEETAEFMHYSWQHLHRLHNRALEELVIE